MTWVLGFAGASIAVLGLAGVARPGAIFAWIGRFAPMTRWLFALGIRLALGTACLVAAPECRHPQLVEALGWFALVAAAGILVIGPRRLDALVRWWLAFATGWAAISFAFVTAFGVFLVYTAW